MQHSTVYRTDGSEEYKEEVEGTVHFDQVDEVNIVPFVYPCGTVSVSSLGSCLSVGTSSNLTILLCLSLLEHAHSRVFQEEEGEKTKIH